MLVARVPSAEVDLEAAAFTTLGAVALHGARIAEAKLGETVAVIGLGLLGQLAVQILRAAGCAVVGIDLLQERAALTVKMGATAATTSEAEFRDLCLRHSNGYGLDSVLITAETASSGPVNLAAEVVRDRGIVVAVGAVGMELDRRPYYEKEIDFRVSRSYGPGRYDAEFEQEGHDYPIGYVRWTETRNMEAFLQLLADGKVNLTPLITHRFAIENATSAYELITGKIKEPYLGVVLQYLVGEEDDSRRLQLVKRESASPQTKSVRIGVLGAGNFARGVLIPTMKRCAGTEFVGICAGSGVSAKSAAEKFGFEFCTTGEEQIFSDQSINTIVIATRHHLHAAQIISALESGKHVFCEKPLCLSAEELTAVQAAYERSENCRLMVGFNRRFAPFARRMKSFLAETGGPFSMMYRVNAGPLPAKHWINDPEEGGGRVLGEVCHFVDLLSFLCGSYPEVVSAKSVPSLGGQDVTATIEFADGSVGTIVYACNGDRSFSKERIEVFGSGCVATLDDFRKLELVRHGRTQVFRSWLRQKKGHFEECQAFVECIRSGGESPIPFEEIIASTEATIRIAEAIRSGSELKVDQELDRMAAPLVS
jgi:predicted dehydrogenase